MAATAFHRLILSGFNIGCIQDFDTIVWSNSRYSFLFIRLLLGIASSVVGTLAGQAIMEGLLGKKVNLWVRRIVTGFINVIPTTIAILLRS